MAAIQPEVFGQRLDGIRVTHLLAADLPLSWRAQEAAIKAGINGP